jgi:hypothetical protein
VLCLQLVCLIYYYFLEFLHRFSTSHTLMAYTSSWNTVVYYPRLKLVSAFSHSNTPQLQCLFLSWNHLCTRSAFINLWSAMMGQVVRKQT